MADLRCPMCGKSNPSELEECQYCQARLKPLYVGQGDDSSQSSGDIPTPEDNGGYEPSLPDWLQSLRLPDEDKLSPSDGASSDWLSGLREQSLVEDEVQPQYDLSDQESKSPQDVGDQDSSWLSDLRSDMDFSAQISDDSKTGPDDETPDWIDNLADSALELSDEATQNNMYDWLSNESEPDDELPSWLFKEDADSEESFSSIENKDVSTPTPEMPEQGEDELDLFSDDVSETQQTTTQAEKETPSFESSDELPSWLFTDEPVESDEVEVDQGDIEAEKFSDEEEETPKWLAMVDLDAEEMIEEEEELPSWLSDLKDSSPTPVAADETPEIPDWLSALDESDQLEEKEIEAESTLEPLIVDDVDAGQLDDLEWLSELEASYPDITVEEADPLGVKPFSLDEEEPEPIIQHDELPEWMSEAVFSEETPQEESEATEGADIDLLPASLPSWLEAMRPVESVGTPIVGELDEQIERAGPLAGLRGVLPAEPEITQIGKPPVYSVKLKVSEAQQAQAAMLSQLISTEGDVIPIPQQPVITSQRVFRIIIGMVMFLAVLVPWIVKGIPVNLPVIGPEIYTTNQIVANVSLGSPVMVAIDYEPGLSGEMDAVAASVLDHLMINGAYLTFVSTTPVGPVQAERLLAKVNKMGDHRYSVVKQYINLGFIPGGATGLQSFSQDFRGTFPVALDGEKIWVQETSPLKTVKDVSNFNLVLVATENTDTMRTWIEQIQPHMAGVPLIVLTSAQAEPIVRPYYETYPQQVQGFVSGLPSAVAYEVLQGRSGIAREYWTPFTVGMIVSVLLILIGSSIIAVSSLLNRKQEPATEEILE